MISCLSTRRCTKKSQKIQTFQDKRRNLQKESLAAKEEMRMLQEEIGQREERHLFLSNKVDKNEMQEAEMVAELQSLHTGEERRGSNASQTGDCCLEALWQQFIALGANQFAFVQRLQREMGAAQGQMPGIEEGRRNSEDQQEQGRTSQQSVLPTPGGISEDAPASSLELGKHKLKDEGFRRSGKKRSGKQRRRKNRKVKYRRSTRWTKRKKQISSF